MAAKKTSEKKTNNFFPIFTKYNMDEVKIEDQGLARYINLDTENIYLGGVNANKLFAKSKIPIIERLINNIMRTETYNQFQERLLGGSDPEALNMILLDYFTSHPEYNEKQTELKRFNKMTIEERAIIIMNKTGMKPEDALLVAEQDIEDEKQIYRILEELE